MRTSMDDTIHVEIQVIELWKEGGIGDNLIDLGIAFADPTVELASIKIEDVDDNMRHDSFNHSFSSKDGFMS